MAKPRSGSEQLQLAGFQNILFKFYVLHNVGNFLSKWKNISFTRMAVLHGFR